MPIVLPASYTTVENIQKVVSRISSVTTLNSADTALFIGKAQAWINGRIAHLYSLPFSAEIPILQDICEDYACGLITRRFFVDQGVALEKGQQSYPAFLMARAEETVTQIASKQLQLVTSSGDIVSWKVGISRPWSDTSGYKPTFDSRRSWEQRVDPDRQDDDEASDV